jgi:hypothetical protein
MGTEITSPADLTDRIKEKIKETFVDLIPEDQWGTLIKSAVDNYIKPRDSIHSNEDKPSQLENDVHAMLKETLKEKVKEKINEYSSSYFDTQGNTILHAEVQKILITAAPSMMAEIMGSIAANVMNNIQNNMRTY